MTYGIILAAGQGSRMKTKEKKQFVKIRNKPVLFYSIDKFLTIKNIKKLIVVINNNKSNVRIFNEILKNYNKEIETGRLAFVFGGKERYNSVYNALSYLNEYCNVSTKDKVLIHDSARPNVDIKDIKKLLLYLNKYNAITLAYKLSDSIKLIKNIDSNIKLVLKSVDRDSFYLISTPQGFNFRLLFDCYQKFLNSKKSVKITDDLQIIELFSNNKTYILDSSKLNFKITTKDDLNMIKYII
ncbi:MAG: 2-C-methyl-D-erythritol 4-phosphate cytidylyltransferase [Lachnospiraceae bacterium]|nr:2-C-methyl-D-erythritol 4-phosphate cytidylyltransferase [Lachnospiraceae bacterium]